MLIDWQRAVRVSSDWADDAPVAARWELGAGTGTHRARLRQTAKGEPRPSSADRATVSPPNSLRAVPACRHAFSGRPQSAARKRERTSWSRARPDPADIPWHAGSLTTSFPAPRSPARRLARLPVRRDRDVIPGRVANRHCARYLLSLHCCSLAGLEDARALRVLADWEKRHR